MTTSHSTNAETTRRIVSTQNDGGNGNESLIELIPLQVREKITRSGK
jgi:hypothetical protein